jgi:hypothetical protein
MTMKPRKGEIWKDRGTGERIQIVHDDTEQWHEDWTYGWVYYPERKFTGWGREHDCDNASLIQYLVTRYEPDETTTVQRLLEEYEKG